jgi:hypothetical protein
MAIEFPGLCDGAGCHQQQGDVMAHHFLAKGLKINSKKKYSM